MSKLNGLTTSNGGAEAASMAAAMPSAFRLAETATGPSGDLIGAQRLDFEAWNAFVRSNCGDQAEVIGPDAFTAWLRPMSVCGLAAAETDCPGEC